MAFGDFSFWDLLFGGDSKSTIDARKKQKEDEDLDRELEWMNDRDG